ncbi:MAG TPA: MerR family transcriptional regulator [Nannocystaceae bacterium]|nr:MerR family transcriptional regulator [Nannocystaceae bacterium]
MVRKRPKVQDPREKELYASTEELQAITNVGRKTLGVWVKLRLLPPAKITSDGNGSKSLWPRIALEQARFIMEKQAQMYTLDEIAKMIEERWPPSSSET